MEHCCPQEVGGRGGTTSSGRRFIISVISTFALLKARLALSSGGSISSPGYRNCVDSGDGRIASDLKENSMVSMDADCTSNSSRLCVLRKGLSCQNRYPFNAFSAA